MFELCLDQLEHVGSWHIVVSMVHLSNKVYRLRDLCLFFLGTFYVQGLMLIIVKNIHVSRSFCP